MESEKVKEIKKALFCLGNNKICTHCNYDDTNTNCVNLIVKDALILINELESENKELKKYKLDWLNGEKMHLQAEMEDTEFELYCANKAFKKVRGETQQLKDRIAELEKENKDYKDRCELIHDLGFDYDGSKTIEDFKILVDELVLVAINGAQVKKGLDETLKEFVE